LLSHFNVHDVDIIGYSAGADGAILCAQDLVDKGSYKIGGFALLGETLFIKQYDPYYNPKAPYNFGSVSQGFGKTLMSLLQTGARIYVVSDNSTTFLDNSASGQCPTDHRAILINSQ